MKRCIELMSLPFVVQRQIIKQMAHGEAFLLSLVSGKSMTMVQRVGWRDTKHINYRLMGSLLAVFVGRRHNPIGEVWGGPLSEKLVKYIKFKFPGSDINCT
uniref:F-box domain-containing protein n=1 Tax=Caenorhabditis tropicalis TaxID=1561998 RepID=A0A1I7U5T1_9PELO